MVDLPEALRADVALRLDQAAQSVRHDRVIVYDEDADRHGVISRELF